MSGAGTAIAGGVAARGHSPLAQLIHALNQPLTGLQCSTELALAGCRPPEYYVRTLQESLQLVSRMRLLVEALRELADLRFIEAQTSAVRLDEVLREIAGELGRVAETKNVHLDVAVPTPLTIEGSRSHCSAILFRLLDAVVSLSHEGSELRLSAAREQNTVCIRVSWTRALSLQDSEFSPPAIGLLVSRAELEQMRAVWTEVQDGDSHFCEIRLPSRSTSGAADEGGLR